MSNNSLKKQGVSKELAKQFAKKAKNSKAIKKVSIKTKDR